MNTKSLAKIATAIDKYYSEIIKDQQHPDRKNPKHRAKKLYRILATAIKNKAT